VLARVVKDPSKNPGREGSMLLLETFEVASGGKPERGVEQEQSFLQVAVSRNDGEGFRRADEYGIPS
jgi:hypothetical protein